MSLGNFGLFCLVFCACTAANLLFMVLNDSVDKHVNLFQTLRDSRLYYLGFIYEEGRKMRISGMEIDEIQKVLIERYDKNAFPFMLYEPKDDKERADRAFIGEVLHNKNLLADYVITPLFCKKRYKEMLKVMALGKEEQRAYLAMSELLVDNSKKSVEDGLVWLPEIFENVIKDPEDPDRKISDGENLTSVYEYFVRDGQTNPNGLLKPISYPKFIERLKIIKVSHPKMRIVSSDKNLSDYKGRVHDCKKRKEAMIARVKEIIKKTAN